MRIIVNENIYKLLSEENSELEDINTSYQIPKDLFKELTALYNKVKDDQKYTTLDGYKRLQNYIKHDGYLSYDWLRRVKNFFDHYHGDENNIIFILNGGDGMKRWVNMTLDSLTSKSASSRNLKRDMGLTQTKYKNGLVKNMGDINAIQYK